MSIKGKRRSIVGAGLIGAVMAAAMMAFMPGGHAQGSAPANPLAALQYRFIGPVGNRADAAVGEPGNPAVAYVGSASGGIFKTTDGGVNWHPIFDHEDVAAIGALAVAPSAHNIVWAGTGEPFLIRPQVTMGDGVYKSTDAGKTWTHMGLDETGHISRVIINPHNPDIVFVCAVGQTVRPQKERGVFKTTDGGKTWKQVLFVNENTGCSDLSMDAHDPQTLFAGTWQLSIRTWILNSGGSGSGIYVTHDGGATWHKLSGHGLPTREVGKVAVQVAPSDPQRVYALMEEDTPRLYRSDNRGRTWRVVNQSHILAERAPYYTRFAISPVDENFLIFPSVNTTGSRDGGETLFLLPERPDVHLHDNHDVWFDPEMPNRIMIANDEGAAISLNGARTFLPIVLPISQMYGVSADNQIPYNVYGNRQDGDSFRGPSNTLEYGSGKHLTLGRISAGFFTAVGGCESGYATPDPVDNNIVWSGCFDGQITRMNLKTGQSHMVSPWPYPTYGWAPAKVKYRWNWAAPLVISPFDHNRVYVGSQVVHMTTDAGQHWTVISPDLTTNDKSHQGNSGGVALDNPPGTYDGSILFSMAASPAKDGILWTGSNDGQVNVTRNDGKQWTNVTKNIPNLPPWGTIASIAPSPFDAGTAYIAVNFAQVGNYDPYVYKTTDYGQSWTLISGGVPKSMNSSANTIIEDPVRKGLLYLGTNNGIYVSWDDGGHWTCLRNNMPPAPVYQLTIQKHYHDLVVGTYGRGIWILDDITPLRNWDKAQASSAYLFPVRPAYRYRTIDNIRSVDADSHVVGQDPPYGADINFYLKAPASHVTITILGPDGKVVRTMQTSGRAGLNRKWWNLRYDPSEPVKIRMSPPGEPWVKPGPDGWRPVISYGFFMGAVLAPPGKYTLKVAAGGQDLSGAVEVLRDPHSVGTTQDIQVETAFLLQIRSELSEMAQMINHLEWTRKQLADLQAMLGEKAQYASVVKAAADLESKATAVEGELIDVHLTGRSEDSFRHPMRLYNDLSYLGSTLDGNWGGSGSDLPPTQPQIDVHKQMLQELAQARGHYKTFTSTAVQAFNNELKKAGLAMAIQP